MGGLPRPRKTGEQINKEGLLENGVLAKVCEPTDEIRRKYKPWAIEQPYLQEESNSHAPKRKTRYKRPSWRRGCRLTGMPSGCRSMGRPSGCRSTGGQTAEWRLHRAEARGRRGGGRGRMAELGVGVGGAGRTLEAALRCVPPVAALATRTGKPRPTCRGGEGKPRGK